MIINIVIIGTIVLICVAASIGLRAKHRRLFGKIQELNTQIREMKEQILLPLRDDVRVQQRLREIDHRDSSNKLAYRHDPFTSQMREDLLIYDFFRDHDPSYFIEAGAYNGVTYSTTYLLEAMGWGGLLVEPIPEEAERCRVNRPGSTVIQSALGTSNARGEVEFTAAIDPRGGALLSFLSADEAHLERCREDGCELKTFKVPLTSLDALLADRTESVGFLSLDIEGIELEVLQGFDINKYQPKLMLIERQSDGGHDHDNAIRDYLKTFGYGRSAVKGSNYFFVHHLEQARFESLLQSDERCS